MDNQSGKCQLKFHRPGEDEMVISLAGSWTLSAGIPPSDILHKEITSSPSLQRIEFDAKELTDWDSGLLIFLRRLELQCSERGINMETGGIPQGLRRLLALASEVPEREGARKASDRVSTLYMIGQTCLDMAESSKGMISFIGESFLSFLRLLRGKARFRRTDLTLLIQECGAQALPIVTLICVLVGVILAFLGAVQLQMFGAEIYVANLVSIGMARELAPLMAGIIMAGRTGGAYAAQLGTMQVNEEIDALSTLGFSPMDFLVLPRMLALCLMMPLLCLYGNLMGIIGGGFVGVSLLDLTLTQYTEQVRASVGLLDFGQGLFKSAVFGFIVAMSGCLRGIQCGRSASAVGSAATSAVVMAIVLIVLADAFIDVIIQIIGI
jgi:phospholipid/cholesterol/gamma-HCH transport system permease protein